MNPIRKIEKVVLFLLLFLLPTQLALHFWPNWAFVFGIRVDFLSPSIYATDILVITLFFINLFSDGKLLLKPLSKYKVYLFLFLIFAILNIIFSISPPVSIYKWIKVIEFSFLIYYFSKQRVLETRSIVKILLFSSVAFSLIGIAQFLKGGTIGFFLYFLGERTFNLNIPGIALVAINGVNHLRAYSTFSHPNSLAGFLGAVMIMVLIGGYFKRSRLEIFTLIIVSICFVLTFSLSAYLGILVVIFFYLIFRKQKLFKSFIYPPSRNTESVSSRIGAKSFSLRRGSTPDEAQGEDIPTVRSWELHLFLLFSIASSLWLPIISPLIINKFFLISQNLNQRLDLAIISGKLISQRFLIGNGLGAFIVVSKVLQPVHNIFLLIFVETGLVGLLIFCYFLYKVILKNPLLFVFIIFTGLTDHYWLTLQQNLLLLSILFGISFKMNPWGKR